MAYHSTIISEYILFQTFNWNKELKRITLPSSQKACYTFLGTIIEFNDLFSAFWVQYHIGLCTQTQRAALKDMKVRIIIIIINLSSFPFEKSISYFVWFSSVSSIDPFTFFFLLVIKNVSVIRFPGNLLNIERVTLLSRGEGGEGRILCLLKARGRLLWSKIGGWTSRDKFSWTWVPRNYRRYFNQLNSQCCHSLNKEIYIQI